MCDLIYLAPAVGLPSLFVIYRIPITDKAQGFLSKTWTAYKMLMYEGQCDMRFIF